ncbi:MAG TPA: hypothetical protein VNK26_04940 [Pyrinomonadaceae bacterium]|nr:hypothetical protein [Pyrinomonadaceae bacterium]
MLDLQQSKDDSELGDDPFRLELAGSPFQFEFWEIFESYGARIRLAAESKNLLENLKNTAKSALLGRLNFLGQSVQSFDAEFAAARNRDGKYVLYFDPSADETAGEPESTDKGQEAVFPAFESEADFNRLLNTLIRVRVGEFTRDWVFIHSGVVSINGKAILLPGDSYSGKSTLTAELVSKGAEYLSDEYAVLDKEGKVHPFDRDISLREKDGFTPYHLAPEAVGKRYGSGSPLEVGLVIFTKFTEGKLFRPRKLSLGMGIMKTMPFVLSVRRNAKFSLKVLNTTFKNAIILASVRGEASLAAEKITEIAERRLL